MADSGLASSVIAAASGLIGTIVGGVITYVLQRVQRKADRCEERIAFARAVSAELRAYIELVTERDHTNNYRKIAKSLREGHDIRLSAVVSKSNPPPEKLFPIFFSQLDKVGLLGEAASGLGRFYTGLGGVIATLDQTIAGQFDQLDRPERANLVETELALWERTLQAGRVVCEDLDRISSPIERH